MRKKYTIFTFIITLILLQTILLTEVFASKENELQEIQEERKEIRENLSAQEKKVAELYEEIKTLKNEIRTQERLVEEKQARVDELSEEIETKLEEIKNLQDEIDTLEMNIENRFDILKSRASSYQKSGGLINYIEVLFGAQSFGDFISRLTAVNQIMDSDASLMEQLEKDMVLLEEYQLETLEKLDELNAKHEEQQAELSQIEEEKKRQEERRASLEEKREELLAFAEELKAEDTRLKSMEEQVKQEIAEAERREREERERRRMAAEKAEQERKKREEEQSELVQTAKTEQKISNAKATSSSQSQTETKEEKEQKTLTVTATAYTADCKGCSGVTSTGINLRKNPKAKVIAVDPSVIPLGSTVYVEGYGYAIAGDVGTDIKGKRIDVFLPSERAAKQWGRRTVKVTIL